MSGLDQILSYVGWQSPESNLPCRNQHDVGALYQCPSTSGTLGDANLTRRHPTEAKTTRLAPCQLGGSAAPEGLAIGNQGSFNINGPGPGYTYTVTGEFKKTDKYCGGSKKKSQLGGGKKKCPHQKIKGDQRHRLHSQCQYVQFNEARQYDNHPIEPPGYYPDLTQLSVGNRAVIGAHDNHKHLPHTVDNCLSDKQNYTGRSFGCRQPFWDEKCV